MLISSQLASRRKPAAAAAVTLFLGVISLFLQRAAAQPVDSNIATTCSLGGSNVAVTVPLTVDDQVDPVEEGAQETMVTKTGKPDIKVEVTINSIVVTTPIPDQIASTDSVTFSGGNMQGSYKIEGSNLVVTFTGPQSSSQLDLPVVTSVHTVKSGIAPTKIDWKVFSQFVADTNYGTATCTPDDPSTSVNTTDVVGAGGGSTTTTGASSTTSPSTTAPDSTTTTEPTTTAPPSSTTTTAPGTPGGPGVPGLPTLPVPTPGGGGGRCSLPALPALPVPAPTPTLPPSPVPCPSVPGGPSLPAPPSLPSPPSMPNPPSSPPSSPPSGGGDVTIDVQIKVDAQVGGSL